MIEILMVVFFLIFLGSGLSIVLLWSMFSRKIGRAPEVGRKDVIKRAIQIGLIALGMGLAGGSLIAMSSATGQSIMHILNSDLPTVTVMILACAVGWSILTVIFFLFRMLTLSILHDGNTTVKRG